MIENDPHPKTTGLGDFINIGLTFLVPFVLLQMLLDGALICLFAFSQGYLPLTPGLKVVAVISAAVGIVNAIYCYRKKYQR